MQKSWEGASRDIRQERRGDMLYRPLGNTGEEVSLIGLGGSHMSKPGDEDLAIRLVREAIDRGITFMDNSWDYGQGQSEIWMGKALRDGYRDKVFLMTKIDGRRKQVAAKQIDESLLRLQVDHVDLLQFHELVYPHDPDLIMDDDGAAAAVEEAIAAGKVRYAGFTGHKDPFIHLRMIEAAKARGFKLSTVQMPLNVMDAHFRSFEKQVLPVLVNEGIGPIGMKSLAGGKILESGTIKAPEAIAYVLNLPISTLVVGVDSMEILDQACDVVRSFDFWGEERKKQVLEKTRKVAMAGKHEPFKTSPSFDATQKNPQWLGI